MAFYLTFNHKITVNALNFKNNVSTTMFNYWVSSYTFRYKITTVSSLLLGHIVPEQEYQYFESARSVAL